MECMSMNISKVSEKTPSLKLLSMVERVERDVEKVAGVGATLTLIALCTIVLLQIFARLFLDTPPVWTEELSRYLFILMIGLAAGIAYKRGELVSVELLYNVLSNKMAALYNWVISATVLAFCLILLPYAKEFADIGQFQLSPTMFFPMSYVFYCTVLIFTNLGLFSLFSLIRNSIKLFNKGSN